jgi:transcriptional regulator with XRE-family HTH domain
VAGWIAAERARCRRPITPGEVGNLEALGARLRELRERAGLSRPALAEKAQLGKTQIELIERGGRRTRRSTLDRLAVALTIGNSNPDELANELASLAGPALATESDHADRVARRRDRRWRKRQRTPEYKREREGQDEIRDLLAKMEREARRRAADLPGYEYAFDDD